MSDVGTTGALAALLEVLAAVRSLRFEARSEAGTGWDGVGEGTVTVARPAEGVIVFEESGIWRPPGRRELSFTNVFRWTAVGDVLRLDHLRFGPDRPV